MAPIGSVLRERKEKVDRSQFDFASLQPITIHFDGSMDRREVDSSREYTMDLFFARPGDVVVAKIDLKNGAVGIVPDWQNVVVTGHFAVYEPDKSRLSPEYLTRIIQAGFFKAYLWRNKVGAEGRKEVKLDFFESILIPLPPLETQQAIVALWQQTQTEIIAANERVKQLERVTAEKAVLDAGIELKPLTKRSKVYILPFKSTDRWGVEFNRWEWTLEDLLTSSKYPMVRLSEVAFINPTDNERLSGETPVSFVPMASVSDETGKIAAPQIRKYHEVQSGYTRFKEQDVIWAKITPCMQNGKCAVARDLHNGIGFGSTEFHVIRPQDTNQLLPEYIWVLLRLEHLKQAAQRYFIGSAGQQRVPAEFMVDLHIPLPPLAVQRDIVRRVEAGRAEIARERESAQRWAREVEAEVEALILGTRKL